MHTPHSSAETLRPIENMQRGLAADGSGEDPAHAGARANPRSVVLARLSAKLSARASDTQVPAIHNNPGAMQVNGAIYCTLKRITWGR